MAEPPDVDLDALARAAKLAATAAGAETWHHDPAQMWGCVTMHPHGLGRVLLTLTPSGRSENDRVLAAHVAACDPATVRALVARVRRGDAIEAAARALLDADTDDDVGHLAGMLALAAAVKGEGELR